MLEVLNVCEYICVYTFYAVRGLRPDVENPNRNYQNS